MTRLAQIDARLRHLERFWKAGRGRGLASKGLRAIDCRVMHHLSMSVLGWESDGKVKSPV
jgi:hypothetical protein